jgi:myo-inositol 2-dehydrogenase/D-chiro-inositol 1-dehydrogenase
MMKRPKTSTGAAGASRKEFLVSPAILAGAAATGGLVHPRSVHAARSDAVRIGLIGCGGRGAGAVASALSVNPSAKLVGVSDAFKDRAETACAPLKKRFPDQVAAYGDRRAATGDR